MYKKILLIALFACINSNAQNFDYKNYGQFLKNYVSEKGNVNYDKIKNNKSELSEVTAQFLKTFPTASWSRDEKIAYYINLYNVFTIKAIIDNYPVKSIRDIAKVWDKDFILLGKNIYSLGDIENKILRKMDEPRIHFAINCASYSCPKLQNDVFVAEKLDKQLEAASKEFVNDKTKNVFTNKEIKISNIFNWYVEDFKKSGSIIDYLNKYANQKIDKSTKIKYLDYNWNLNK